MRSMKRPSARRLWPLSLTLLDRRASACGRAGVSLAKTSGSTAIAPPMPAPPMPAPCGAPGAGPNVLHTRRCAACQPPTSRLRSATRCSTESSITRCASTRRSTLAAWIWARFSAK